MPERSTAPNAPPPPDLVEVLDASRRAVALLPEPEALRQKLPRRTVAVLLHDAEGRLILRKRQGRWDIFVHGPVLAGEAVSEAVTRVLKNAAGIHAERLRPLLELPAQPENGNEFLHLFAHTLRAEAASGLLGQPQAAQAAAEEYAFSAEELACLLRDFRELVAPRLLFLADQTGVSRQRAQP